MVVAHEWLMAWGNRPTSFHIGASGLLYALASFFFLVALSESTQVNVYIYVCCFPLWRYGMGHFSYEKTHILGGHLAGALAGLILAMV